MKKLPLPIPGKYDIEEYKKYVALCDDLAKNQGWKDNGALTFEEWKEYQKDADEVLGLINKTIMGDDKK